MDFLSSSNRGWTREEQRTKQKKYKVNSKAQRFLTVYKVRMFIPWSTKTYFSV